MEPGDEPEDEPNTRLGHFLPNFLNHCTTRAPAPFPTLFPSMRLTSSSSLASDDACGTCEVSHSFNPPSRMTGC